MGARGREESAVNFTLPSLKIGWLARAGKGIPPQMVPRLESFDRDRPCILLKIDWHARASKVSGTSHPK
jgi:hypothetical protein